MMYLNLSVKFVMRNNYLGYLAKQSHKCDEFWIGSFRPRIWINEWKWYRFSFQYLPPLNINDPPHDCYIFLLIISKITIRIDYSISGPWCTKGWFEGFHK